MTTQLSSAAAKAPFRAAAFRTAASPTAALAQALDTAAIGMEQAEATRLAPRAGSFDPSTAAVMSTWRQP